MGWPTTFVSKSLLLASSTSIGSISTAGGGTVTLSCATLDTARRISVACSSIMGFNVTIAGLNQQGSRISEIIATSTTVPSAGTTTQDFLKVSSVVLSCAITNSSGGCLIGTTSQGGTPWMPVDTTRNPMNVGFSLTPISSLTATSFEYTQDWPDYNPNTGLWSNSTTGRGPQPTISSMGSSVIGPTVTQGSINFPITAWRITFSASNSSGTGGTAASVTQLGV